MEWGIIQWVIPEAETRNYLHQGDEAGIFVWWDSNTANKDECMKKTNEFIHVIVFYLKGQGK